MSALAGLVLCKVLWEQGSEVSMWTCHAREGFAAPNTLFNMNALSSALGGYLVGTGGWLSLMTSDARFLGVEVQDVSPTGFGSVMDSAFAADGTDGAPATGLSAITVTKLTGVGGRANRGRSYIGAMSYDRVIDEGTEWEPAFTTAIGAMYQGFIEQMADTDGSAYAPMLYHRASDTVTEITAVRANSEIYRQAGRVR